MDTNQRLEQLKQKYQSVLNFISGQPLQLQNVHVENDKLLIRGIASSDEVKNRVWDQIKLVDPTYSDLVADIRVEPGNVPSTSQAQAQAPPSAPPSRTYTVKPGDTLSKIAKEIYGNANDYMRIFDANKDKLSDPNKIQVGQVLSIPAA
jgi:LysM repeat protein